jgi:hypothetical protein
MAHDISIEQRERLEHAMAIAASGEGSPEQLDAAEMARTARNTIDYRDPIKTSRDGQSFLGATLDAG